MENVQIKAAVITISDTRTQNEDLSGRTLAELLWTISAEVVESGILTDDLEQIRNTLYGLAEREDINLIVTTGGTGFGPRDNTPEATRSVIDREAPGLSEAMRRSTAEATPLAMLSRGVCGIRGNTLIVNLPGSPKAVEECFEVIRPVLNHAVSLLSGKQQH
ncbi:MAG: molybdenum cofactor biosynthesis protein B [Pyrinomonadaceae bacterium]